MKMSQISTFHLSFSILCSLLIQVEFSKGCVERERLALLDFKNSFASLPNNYGKLSSWNSSEDAKDCCSWEGIICDKHTEHVVSLDLDGQGLESYQLRPSLLELQHLRRLVLSENNLAMRIPEFIGSLSKLTSLELYEAGFFGMIPPQLGNLSNIQFLYLGGNELSIDNFQWLSHLPFLDKLFIDSINFSEARDWLFVLRKLRRLFEFDCTSCYFPTPNFPSTSSNHFNSSLSLQIVRIFESNSSSSTMSLFINSTYNLSELHMDYLSLDGQFPNIFDQIGNYCNLKYLKLRACSINYSILDILQALSACASNSLENLDLSSNNLTGIIPPMLKFPSLRFLELDDNHLEGFAPHNSYISSRNFTNGTLLNTNHLFPSNLSELYISSNNLKGVLLSEYFANLSQLSSLDLGNNPNLTISFKETPTEIELLDLRSCNLGPNFPTWLIDLKKIYYFDISQSNIFGSLPIIFWGNLPSTLMYFNLSSNNLHGIVPNLPFPFDQQGSAYPNIIIDLSWNAFYGPIPFCFFKVTVLYLSYNNFSSFAPLPHSNKFPFPRPTDSVTYMLDISNNNLLGELTHQVWLAISRYNTINLANNNLSGKVPSSLGYPTNLFVLNLSNNRFYGPLPSSLKNCPDMKILDLSRNKFSGLIPSWLGESLKSLVVFSLQSNNFSGSVPIKLCHLSSLQILDLSYNKLSGTIPSCVYNFPAMAHDVDSSSEIWYPLIIYKNEQTLIGEEKFSQAMIKWKGMDRLFEKNLILARLMDLSNNNLSGEIPTELMSLIKLDSLDLSSNNFHGSIPNQIGQLKSLEYLNLSYNKLSGPIPPSLSDISSLSMLDFSYNNLSGRIPKGTQLQGFNSSAFSGNSELCGLPLQVKCLGDVDDFTQALQPSVAYDSEKEDEWVDKQCFFAGLGVGFTCSFFGILGTLIWIRNWRYAFFHFSTEFGEWILLVVALNASKISRKLRFK